MSLWENNTNNRDTECVYVGGQCETGKSETASLEGGISAEMQREEVNNVGNWGEEWSRGRECPVQMPKADTYGHGQRPVWQKQWKQREEQKRRWGKEVPRDEGLRGKMRNHLTLRHM